MVFLESEGPLEEHLSLIRSKELAQAALAQAQDHALAAQEAARVAAEAAKASATAVDTTSVVVSPPVVPPKTKFSV